MRDLHNNPDITIKPADKGGSIVIMHKVDYVTEAHRQLFNQEHYKTLDKDPTIPYNKYTHHLIDQAWRIEIIDETTKESLKTKNPKIPSFYLLPKIHKPNNPQRPMVNSIGSVTEKISAFVDKHLRKFTSRIPSYVKDTTHFINITKNIHLKPDGLLVTIDVSSLFTNCYVRQCCLEFNFALYFFICLGIFVLYFFILCTELTQPCSSSGSLFFTHLGRIRGVEYTVITLT